MKSTLVVMVTLLTSSEAWLFNNVAMVNLPRITGCTYMDQFYIAGTDILNGYDAISDTCYGISCDANGNKINWYTPNCYTTPPPEEEPTITPPPPTTTPPPPTTTPPPPDTTPLGCFYEGSWHPFGSMITSGKDRASNWCWSVHCSWDGQILHGDDFNCFPSSSTTVPPTTVPPTTRPTTP